MFPSLQCRIIDSKKKKNARKENAHVSGIVPQAGGFTDETEIKNSTLNLGGTNKSTTADGNQ